MRYYVAIVEDAGPEAAIGIWFPDLPGCFSAGDTIEEAMRNAAEAIGLYAAALDKDGKPLPTPRTLDQLRHQPDFLAEVKDNMVALISAPYSAVAAE